MILDLQLLREGFLVLEAPLDIYERFQSEDLTMEMINLCLDLGPILFKEEELLEVPLVEVVIDIGLEFINADHNLIRPHLGILHIDFEFAVKKLKGFHIN